MEEQLTALEAKPARYSGEVEAARLAEMRSAYAMNMLEGAGPLRPELDRLFKLAASGRISEAAYFRLALLLD